MANMATDHTYSAKKRKRTGFSCAVYECSGTHAHGLSLHTFPRDVSIRQQWIKFVTTCRADFGPQFGTPNKYSCICSRHFTPDCYPESYALKDAFCIEIRKKSLKPDAVPTIQKHEFSRPTRAAEKRKRCQTLPLSYTSSTIGLSLPVTSSATYTAALHSPSIAVTSIHSLSSSTCTADKTKTKRGYAKREHCKAMEEIMPSWNPESKTKDQAAGDNAYTLLPCSYKDEQPAELTLITTTAQTIVHGKSKRVQVYSQMRHKGVQVRPSTASKKTQCSLDLEMDSSAAEYLKEET